MPCPAVGEIVAVHRSDDDVLEAELLDRACNVFRLVVIERAGQALQAFGGGFAGNPGVDDVAPDQVLELRLLEE